ncbi:MULTISPECIES: VOC family protein [Actinomadura]|uniref:VOC family protein n=1 Tax=Actinomadura yumaensis TaxID=111807 RepID=A0ABW2CJA5_9ACTN|nr:VOC family protein [Actinomadura sp. J1-007]MWK36979.1 VOC family protein [Actinomadura sp. J1-007]
MATARLYRIIVPVSDMKRATAFYGHVFDDAGERISEGRHYFDCDGTILVCYDAVADGDARGAFRANPGHVYFAVSDLESVCGRVNAAGGLSVGEIKTRTWGERSFYGKDPFGNPICFVDSTTLFTRP